MHQLRLLIVLDTGGAVKQNHLDLYHGMGYRAGIEAGHYKHFGRVWKLGLENSATQAPWALPPENDNNTTQPRLLSRVRINRTLLLPLLYSVDACYA